MKPPTTAARKVPGWCKQGHLTDCSSTLPHEAGRWHVSGRSGKKGSKPDRPACAWPFRVGLPRQGTEVAHARPPCATCSRALPRLGHRERGPAAGVLESLRAGADAKGPRGSLGKSGPRLGRLTSARRGTRCTAHRASASVLPAPASAPIPVSGDMVSWLACRGDVLEQMVPASGGVGALSDDIAAGDLVSAPRRRKATTGHVVANAEPLQPIERIVCDYKGPCTCDGDRCASADNRCNCNPSHDGNSRPTRMIQRGGVAKITQRKE